MTPTRSRLVNRAGASPPPEAAAVEASVLTKEEKRRIAKLRAADYKRTKKVLSVEEYTAKISTPGKNQTPTRCAVVAVARNAGKSSSNGAAVRAIEAAEEEGIKPMAIEHNEALFSPLTLPDEDLAEPPFKVQEPPSKVQELPPPTPAQAMGGQAAAFDHQHPHGMRNAGVTSAEMQIHALDMEMRQLKLCAAAADHENLLHEKQALAKAAATMTGLVAMVEKASAQTLPPNSSVHETPALVQKQVEYLGEVRKTVRGQLAALLNETLVDSARTVLP